MNPYPGLRPFGESDQAWFFGREDEIDELLSRIAAHRLIAVLGVSGCGKSSLVHAGLIPVLRSGLAESLGGHWRIYTLAPGSSPLESLDQALGVTLERRSHALRGWAAGHTPDERILIFVDQFEEIFAYRRGTLSQDGGNAAALFVDSLITAVTDPSVPVYVVLTMRTDYLGECAVFRSLSEALNDGSYLVPRLSRMRQKEAIERPALSLGVAVQPGLVQRLLNESEGDPDKLPLLQHLLKRLWEYRNDGPLDVGLYERIGGWEHALERDAEEVLGRFPDQQRGIRRMFQWLAEVGVGDKPVRRRRPAAELPAISGLSPLQVERILDAFAGRGFLRREAGQAGLVDFEHESVMWQWSRLRNWIAHEAEDAARIRFFHEATFKQQLLTGSTLEDARAFRERSAATPGWASRYIEDPRELQEVLDWIGESEARQKSELAGLRRSRRWLAMGLAAALLAVLVIAWLSWRSYQSQKTAEAQLARNDWTESRYAQDKGNVLVSLHFAAEAIRLKPEFEKSILLDVRALWPDHAVRTLLHHGGAVLGARFSADESRILTWSDDHMARLWDAPSGRQMVPALRHSDIVYGATFSPDESRILSWSFDKTARLWDARTGQSIGQPMQHEAYVNGAEFSHDGTRILTWSSDHTAKLWNARTAQAVGTLQHPEPVEGALFTDDDGAILTWDVEGTELWDARTLQKIFHSTDGGSGAVFSHDRRHIFAWGLDGGGRMLDAATGKRSGPDYGDIILDAVFSHDDQRILIWSHNNAVMVLDVRSGKAIGSPIKHRSLVAGARFNRDESRILTWSSDRTAGLWDAQTGKPIFPPLQHQNRVRGAQFNRDESRILTWSDDKTARLWDARTGQPIGQPLQHQDAVNGAQFSRDESRILTWSGDNTARLWAVWTDQGPPPMRHPYLVNGADFNHNESQLLTWGGEWKKGAAQVWNARTGEPVGGQLEHQDSVGGAEFNKDGSRILTVSDDHTACLWDAQTGKLIFPPLRHEGSVRGADFNRDESRIYTWSDDHTARQWDARTGQQIGPPLQHQDDVRGVRLNKDVSRILTWSDDHTARLWDSRSGRQIGPALQHQDKVYGAEFNRDESRILTWSADGTARQWDARTGRPIGTPMRHEDEVNGAEYNHEESRILTWSDDGTARLWDAKTGKAIGAPLQDRDKVVGGGFSADGKLILTRSGNYSEFNDVGNGAVQVWDAFSGKRVIPPLEHQNFIAGLQLSNDESLILTWSFDNTARLWDMRTGLALGPPLQHQGSVMDAGFNRDETRILTASLDRTARIWVLNVDLDFPSQYVPLWLQARTASKFDLLSRQVQPLTAAEWTDVRRRYEEIAAAHARVCKYKEFNDWLKEHGGQSKR